MHPFKPMLAATLEHPSRLIYPQLVSPKLDGIRCIIHEGRAVSRNLKPIRNRYIQDQLWGLPDGYDGELIVGSPTEGNVLNRTTSGVMSAEGHPEFMYHVFDNHKHMLGFEGRLMLIKLNMSHPRLVLVEHRMVHSVTQFEEAEREFLAQGYEGIMSRLPHGQYKHGRATNTDQLLHKYKQFVDGELLVTGIREGNRNDNEATRDALGELTRSTHKNNMVPNGMVGTILGTDLKTGQQLEVSPGRISHDMRKFYWENPHRIVGSIGHYRYFGYGNVAAPRFATWQAFREAGT